jgi:hypothetical protein
LFSLVTEGEGEEEEEEEEEAFLVSDMEKVKK